MDFRFGLDSAHKHIGQPTKLAKFRILHPSVRKSVNMIDTFSRYVTAPFQRHKLRSVQWAWNVFTDGVYVAIWGIRLCLGICLQIQRRITKKPVRIADKSTDIRTGHLAATCSAVVNFELDRKLPRHQPDTLYSVPWQSLRQSVTPNIFHSFTFHAFGGKLRNGRTYRHTKPYYTHK